MHNRPIAIRALNAEKQQQHEITRLRIVEPAKIQQPEIFDYLVTMGGKIINIMES